MKKTILFFYCLISIGLQAVETSPELVQQFFKRFTQQLGSSRLWSFTTRKIDAGWGNALLMMMKL